MSEGFESILWPLLAIATVTDLRSGKIFNVMTLPAIAVGIGARFFLSGLPGASTAFLAVGAAFVLFFPLYVFKVFAAGDVKLLMAVGAWSNTDLVVRLGIFAIVIGAVVGAFLLLRTRGFKLAAKSVAAHVREPAKESESSFRMPFAPAILSGFFILKIMALKGWSL